MSKSRFDHQITAQKMKFAITDFFSKCDQIRSFLRIWSHLLRKIVMKNFIFCAVDFNFDEYSISILNERIFKDVNYLLNENRSIEKATSPDETDRFLLFFCFSVCFCFLST